MTLISGDTVKSAVCRKLKAEFPAYEVYKDKPVQNAVKPYFFVEQVSLSQRKVRRDTWERIVLLDIRYHTGENTRSVLDQMGGELCELLSALKIESGIYRGSGQRTEIVDGVLHAFAAYTIHGHLGETTPYLSGLSYSEGVK
ncbi:MAG: DUF6838 family protein [Oscillospiraceae bacterium]